MTDERGVAGEFIDWCCRDGRDPVEVLAELNAEDWRREERVTMSHESLKIYEDEE
jgi:hypothetical protein